MHPTNNIELNIINILKENNIPIDESIIILARLIHCSALALKTNPTIIFTELLELSKNNFTKDTN